MGPTTGETSGSEEFDRAFSQSGRYVRRLLEVELASGVEKRVLKEKLGFLDVFWCEEAEVGGTVSFPNLARAAAERCAMSVNDCWICGGVGSGGEGKLSDRWRL